MKYKQNQATDPAQWKLEEAKARFSEVVRRAQKRPQHVTVRGRETAVVISADYFARLLPESKMNLVDILQEAPVKEIQFGGTGEPMPVREVEL